MEFLPQTTTSSREVFSKIMTETVLTVHLMPTYMYQKAKAVHGDSTADATTKVHLQEKEHSPYIFLGYVAI